MCSCDSVCAKENGVFVRKKHQQVIHHFLQNHHPSLFFFLLRRRRRRPTEATNGQWRDKGSNLSLQHNCKRYQKSIIKRYICQVEFASKPSGRRLPTTTTAAPSIKFVKSKLEKWSLGCRCSTPAILLPLLRIQWMIKEGLQ